MNPYFDNTTKAGTACGTLLSMVGNLHPDDLLKTIILASIGAMASFSVTLLMKIIIRKIKK
jgi:hypothetical protein